MFSNASSAYKGAEDMARRLMAAEQTKKSSQTTGGCQPKPRKVKGTASKKKSSSASKDCATSVSSLESSASDRNNNRKTSSSRGGALFGRRGGARHQLDDHTKEAQQQHDRHAQAQRSMQILDDSIQQQDALETETSHKITALKSDAKTKLTQGNQPAAIRVMRQVKRYESKRQDISNRIDKLQNQRFMIESALDSFNVVQALQAGNTAMQDLNGRHHEVDTVLSDLQDQFDAATQVNDLFQVANDGIISSIVADDQDLLRELLMDDAIALPMVPTTPLPDGGRPPMAQCEAVLVQPDGEAILVQPDGEEPMMMN